MLLPAFDFKLPQKILPNCAVVGKCIFTAASLS